MYYYQLSSGLWFRVDHDLKKVLDCIVLWVDCEISQDFKEWTFINQFEFSPRNIVASFYKAD